MKAYRNRADIKAKKKAYDKIYSDKKKEIK